MEKLRHDWCAREIHILFELPLTELLFKAQAVHRENFAPDTIQLSTLLNIKTGACPENCAYCPQSGHYATGVTKANLLSIDTVLEHARNARANGASRFCMGAAWRSPPKNELPKVLEMIKAVKALGLETCATLGMLDAEQAAQLKAAELDYYNHNLDSSPEFYKKIISTRTYQERLDTLEHVRAAELKVCCGGIVGMGESRADRVALLLQLVNLPEHPLSVPINRLIPIEGTPLSDASTIDDFEFIRTVAVARLLMPRSFVRLSAGRTTMSDTMQALCFLAGVNSVHYGEKLFITENPAVQKDRTLFTKLGLHTV